MAKASLTLPDGTIVQIEGNADEIQKIVSLRRSTTSANFKNPVKSKRKLIKKGKSKGKESLNMIKDLNLRPKGKESLEDFISKKKPSSHKEKVTVCIYYLSNILNIKSLTYNHIHTCYKHNNWRHPSNLINMTQQAGTEGWLDTSNNIDIKITVQGENLVEHELPKKETK